MPLGTLKGNMPHKKGTKTSETFCGDFPCGICRNNCTTFGIQCFNCLKWFHVSCTDLSEEKFRTFENFNGCFWACLHCRTQVVIPQDQSNIKEELSQKIKDLQSNLKSEVDSFITEIRDCIRNVQIIIEKFPKYKNSSLQKHQLTTIKLKN